MVADNESGKSIESEVRTSSGMFLSKGQVHKILLCLEFQMFDGFPPSFVLYKLDVFCHLPCAS